MKHFFITSFIRSSNRIVLALVFLISVKAATAQDFHLSQYDAPPMFLNPALTGMFDGKYRIHGHFRQQWMAVATKPYNTAGISFDMPIKKFGIGVQVFNYRAGVGNYNALSALVSVGYDVVFDQKKNHHLALGVQGGIIQKTVDQDKLSYENQYTTANGGGFDAGIASGESFSNSNFMLPSVNAGFLYYFAKDNARLNPFIGFSAFNLTQPTESFYGSSNKLPIRYYAHGGVKVNVSSKIQLLPKFIYMKQINDQELTATLLLHYFLESSETYIIFGPTYRNKDAAIIEAGIKKGRYTARVSYDINTSKLKEVSNSRGGFEVSLTYIARRSKPNPLANCPRL